MRTLPSNRPPPRITPARESIPSRRILEIRVVREIPRRVAAPCRRCCIWSRSGWNTGLREIMSLSRETPANVRFFSVVDPLQARSSRGSGVYPGPHHIRYLEKKEYCEIVLDSDYSQLNTAGPLSEAFARNSKSSDPRNESGSRQTGLPRELDRKGLPGFGFSGQGVGAWLSQRRLARSKMQTNALRRTKRWLLGVEYLKAQSQNGQVQTEE
jgi:hypothetical protein